MSETTPYTYKNIHGYEVEIQPRQEYINLTRAQRSAKRWEYFGALGRLETAIAAIDTIVKNPVFCDEDRAKAKVLLSQVYELRRNASKRRTVK